MNVQSAYQQYKTVQVKTANGGRLIIILYEGAIKFLRLAKKHIREGNLEGANNNLIKAQNIINELSASLDEDKGGDISRNLSSLYQFMNRKLVQANINKEIESVEMVEELLLEILETWKQVLNGEKGKEKDKGVKMEA